MCVGGGVGLLGGILVLYGEGGGEGGDRDEDEAEEGKKGQFPSRSEDAG